MSAVVEVPCVHCSGGRSYGMECPRCCGTGARLEGRRPIPDPSPRLSESARERAERSVRRVLSRAMSMRSEYAAPLVVRALGAWRPGRDPVRLVEELALVSPAVAAETVRVFLGAIEEHARVLDLPLGRDRDRQRRAEHERRELEALAGRMRAA